MYEFKLPDLGEGIADLEVFDPQLGRLVTSADSSLILVRWREQNAYLLHTVGSDGDTTGGGAYYPDFPHQMKPVTIFWLIVGGFCRMRMKPLMRLKRHLLRLGLNSISLILGGDFYLGSIRLPPIIVWIFCGEPKG